VITFPGSLDDGDAARAVRAIGAELVNLWHADADLRGVDAVVVPGGFSYGDYLRPGAIASQAPVMRSVIDAARGGMPVLGICNGFQVLCEAGLLPGALMRNAGLTFRCRDQYLRVERGDTVWTGRYAPGRLILIPLKHAEGRYVAAERDLDQMEAEGRVLFRYSAGPHGGDGGTADDGDPAADGNPGGDGVPAGDGGQGGDGIPAGDANPNGSLRDIAGVCSADGRIAGLMPHPEHAIDALTGPSTDGLHLFASLADALGLPAPATHGPGRLHEAGPVHEAGAAPSGAAASAAGR
jgi:phosphoribosylformylglycinamidine synthase